MREGRGSGTPQSSLLPILDDCSDATGHLSVPSALTGTTLCWDEAPAPLAQASHGVNSPFSGWPAHGASAFCPDPVPSQASGFLYKRHSYLLPTRQLPKEPTGQATANSIIPKGLFFSTNKTRNPIPDP